MAGDEQSREVPGDSPGRRVGNRQRQEGRRSATTVSEPVAAAVYWLWQAKHDGADLDFAGKHILVCDVGGGTLDLSLVRVGADDEPLTVVDAINNNYAGDSATALLMARAAKQYNNENGTSLPTDAEEILRQLGDEPIAQLRSWFVRPADDAEGDVHPYCRQRCDAINNRLRRKESFLKIPITA